MMRIKRLPILASVLLLAACTADIQPPVRQTLEAGPQAQDTTATRLVHYRATVGDGGGNTTRASINTDGKYIYSDGDMLFVRSTGADEGKVYGALILDGQDAGKSTGVTFEGDLHLVGYGEEEEPSADMPLEAILVGPNAQLYDFNKMCDQITGFAWPKDGALTTTLAKAVERYSTLSAQSTYGQQSFQLSQGSCFVEFSVTLDDGTEVNAPIETYVFTDAVPTDRRNGTVNTIEDGEGHIKANFVAAFPGGDTVLDGAVVGLDLRSPIGFGGSGTILEANKVYHVNRTFTRQPATISFDETSLIMCYPDASFQIEAENTGDGAVTYISDDDGVATVAYNEYSDQWIVTITGAGETDLKAIVTDGANSVYSEHTVSCHLKVYAPVPLASVDASHVGWVIGTDGKAYIKPSGIYAANKRPVAMIGYVGTPGTVDASSTDTSTGYRGLAIALSDAVDSNESTSIAWTDDGSRDCTTNGCDQNDFPAIIASMTGIENTNRLASNTCGTGHTHSAASVASTYKVMDESMEVFAPTSIGCSPWFLPSTGQWFKVFEGCGVTTDQWTAPGNCPGVAADNYNAIQHLMTAAGGVLSSSYWTSTERIGKRFAFYVGIGSTFGVSMRIYTKTGTCHVRPFIAF